jgi:hypothetical protein
VFAAAASSLQYEVFGEKVHIRIAGQHLKTAYLYKPKEMKYRD